MGSHKTYTNLTSLSFRYRRAEGPSPEAKWEVPYTTLQLQQLVTRQYESSFKCKHHARSELLRVEVEVEVVEDAESLPYEARHLVDTGLGPLLTFSDIDRKV